jgi:hypothetical protein
MGRGRKAQHGRRAGIPVVTFRLSLDERRAGEAAAAREKCSPNELARRWFLAGLGLAPPMSTELGAKPGAAPRDLTVVYEDEGGSE